jgi:molecular chaperone GrpE
MNPNENAEDLKKEEKVEAIEEATEIEAKAEDPYKDKYYYLAAEFQNTQKRFEREKVNMIKFGNENILKDIISVVDTFELTLSALKPDQDPKVKNIVVGLDMVNKQLMDVLRRYGLQKVETLGKEFDPNFSEAVAQEFKDGAKENEILSELQSGYTLNGRLLRAAKVTVASTSK